MHYAQINEVTACRYIDEILIDSNSRFNLYYVISTVRTMNEECIEWDELKLEITDCLK